MRVILLLILLSGCSSNNQLMDCRLELYCTRSEDSVIKAGAFKAIEVYFGTDLNDGICEKHYQAWGFDYRLPVDERCGSN